MFDFDTARHHMVESQIRTNDVTDLPVLRAFRSIPREAFVPKSKLALAYADTHVELDNERAMMRPREFAKMVQAADIKPSDVVLDIACGRGYSSAVLARLAETVVGLEDSDERVEKATAVLTEQEIMNAVVIKGDLKSGAREHGPFDVIFVNGAIADVPDSWMSQLAQGGRLVVIRQDGQLGHAVIYTKGGDSIGDRVLFDASAPGLSQFRRETAFAL